MRLPRFIIVAFDALRRDMITEALAPTLRRFLDEGCAFPLSRCVFSPVTRVNAAALGCGAAEAGACRQCIRLWRVGRTAYMDHGWMEALQP